MRTGGYIIMRTRIKIIAGIVALIILGLGLRLPKPSTSAFYYVDFEGQLGVAKNCWENKNGLICERAYGGKQLVQQYWEEN